MNVLKQLKEFYWPEKSLLFMSIITMATATALGIVYPKLLQYLIDDIIKEGQYQLVPALAFTAVAVIAVKALFQFMSGLCGGNLGNRVAYNLRNALYKKLQYMSFQYYDNAKTGDLMTRLTGDLEAFRLFVGFGFAQILNLFLMVGFASIMMFSIHWQLTLIILVTMPVLAFTAVRFENKIHPAFRQSRKAMSNLTTAVQENIMGVRTVKSFAREPYEVEKFSVRSEEFKTNQLDAAHIFARFFPFMELISSATVVLTLAAGGYFHIHNSLTTGELVAFFGYIWFIIGPMFGLGFHINNYTQSKASGERILEVLNQYIHVKDKDHAVVLHNDHVAGHVRFEHVTFAYPDKQPALLDLNIDAPPGSVIGFLGETGSGKSTVIQLLIHAYHVKDGRITLDGMDINDISVESLRKQMAVVFQETFLFSATIRSNIAYGNRNVSMEHIIYAAKLAQANDFIMELPLGYETVVGERGLGLSGGQKQRIAIARALLKDPKILVLDDATSAVDMETEHEIQAGFKELMNGRTTFIIAHRISSLRHADEIIVLDQGKVIQRGTHQQLLGQPGTYAETYRIQYADQPNLAEVVVGRRLAN